MYVYFLVLQLISTNVEIQALNKLGTGLNCLTIRFHYLNGKITLEWFDTSLNTFK
jgi:hypothetical protein